MKMKKPVKKNQMPSWLPPGALVFADFKNGHYFANGSECSIDDIFISDPDWGVWAPEITPGVGITAGDGNGTIANGVAAGLLTSGYSVRVANYSQQAITIDSHNRVSYENEFQAARNAGHMEIAAYGVNQYDVTTPVPDTSGKDIFAATITGAHIASSVNGSPTASANFIVVTFDAVVVSLMGTESIAFYPPSSDAGLPALSV